MTVPPRFIAMEERVDLFSHTWDTEITLDALEEELARIRTTVPARAEAARLYFEVSRDDGLTVYLRYRRPETAEEREKRVARLRKAAMTKAQRQQSRAEQQVQKEQALLQSLAKKYKFILAPQPEGRE